MSSSSTDTGIVKKVILNTLVGDMIEVEGNQIVDVAKAYFDTPFDEDVHFLSTNNINNISHILMIHVPFHTQIQTYVKIKQVKETIYTIQHRVLDLQGRVYMENKYRIRQMDKEKFVWLDKEIEMSPVMPSFSSLVHYMAHHLQPDPNATPRMVELEKEFMTQRLEVDWNRFHNMQTLLRIRFLVTLPGFQHLFDSSADLSFHQKMKTLYSSKENTIFIF